MIIKVILASIFYSNSCVLEGKHKFQWIITFTKEALAKIYDDGEAYKSDGKYW